MEVLYLRANNLTGQLPVSLTNMTKLNTLWIGSNDLTGKIPNYFLSWKELQMLEMQASGLEGPIPSTLSALSRFISDFNGESSSFPDLSNMKNMQKLMLRSCNITGSIPEYISNMTSLQVLDLSFNRLEGSIPNIDNVIGLATIYLTSNWLTGLPEWIKSRDTRCIIDLSYNNFPRDSVPNTCRETFNVFRGFSRLNNSILSDCLSPCSKGDYICGTSVLGIKYRYEITYVLLARGLAFLHEESTLKIVHRDIKMTNILLDKDLNPKNLRLWFGQAGRRGEDACQHKNCWNYRIHGARICTMGLLN